GRAGAGVGGDGRGRGAGVPVRPAPRCVAAGRMRVGAAARSVVAMTDRPEILVVCVKNAGRSVAARVLLDHYAGDQVVVRSAGSRPGDTIHPAVARVLSERGLDVSKEFPKALDDEMARSADVI